MRKTKIRFYTIADYEDEELWLREQHKNGWKLVKMTPPCFYTFESCEPEDVIYRLDFKNGRQSEEYLQMLNDFGWEYFFHWFGWMYFRKPANAAEAEGEEVLFSDNASRVNMAEHIVRTRLIPISIIFLCCVIPNLINGFMGVFSIFFCIYFAFMFGLNMYIIIHSGIKLSRIQAKNKSDATVFSIFAGIASAALLLAGLTLTVLSLVKPKPIVQSIMDYTITDVEGPGWCTFGVLEEKTYTVSISITGEGEYTFVLTDENGSELFTETAVPPFSVERQMLLKEGHYRLDVLHGDGTLGAEPHILFTVQ